MLFLPRTNLKHCILFLIVTRVKSPASASLSSYLTVCRFNTWSVDLILCAVRGPRAIRTWQVVSCDRPLWTGHIYGKIMEWFWWLEKVPELFRAACRSSLRPPSLSSMMNVLHVLGVELMYLFFFYKRLIKQRIYSHA